MPTHLPLTKKLRKALHMLRQHYPPRMSVQVKCLEELGDYHGYVEFGEAKAYIAIKKDIDSVMCDTLIEEWSHVLRHEIPINVEDEHDGLFWQIFGSISMRWRGDT